jgi:DNA-binding transcriptional MerR regulator
MKTGKINLEKDVFTIGEVADILKVDQHVIRFWTTQFNKHIQPIRKAGLRRYYSKKDIDYLVIVKEELYNKGLSIRGLQLKLENHLKEQTNNNHNPYSHNKEEIKKIITNLKDDLYKEINRIDGLLNQKKY